MTTAVKKSNTRRESNPKPKNKTHKEMIPDDKLLVFIGNIKNLLKIDQCQISDTKYRINVWTQEWHKDRLCASNRIYKSFFVKYENEKIIDQTIYPKRQKGIFDD